jgi:hypothetical protein
MACGKVRCKVGKEVVGEIEKTSARRGEKSVNRLVDNE